jgi:hypothetical protein
MDQVCPADKRGGAGACLQAEAGFMEAGERGGAAGFDCHAGERFVNLDTGFRAHKKRKENESQARSTYLGPRRSNS